METFLAYAVDKFDYYVFLFNDPNGFDIDIDILKLVYMICVIYLNI